MPLSKRLQNKACDLIKASSEARVVKTMLQTERDDDTTWDTLYAKAMQLASDVGVQPSVPRMQGLQRNRPNAPAADPSIFWTRNMFFPFVDHLIKELDDRLLKTNGRFKAQWLIPAQACCSILIEFLKLVQRNGLSQEQCKEVFQCYSANLPIDATEDLFLRECDRWRICGHRMH
ncbi:uncharacterized protein LOC123566094 [Mercenaria mercenaria]|uniref:uncharacterized protein LOC123566094 n=1 Tax=Mercenaria mercenaria TaxID=6596 RepID=UPI00234F6CA2|nr:uncharacterized protein LOC123566094 [Mercenaria mercenaria]